MGKNSCSRKKFILFNRLNDFTKTFGVSNLTTKSDILSVFKIKNYVFKNLKVPIVGNEARMKSFTYPICYFSPEILSFSQLVNQPDFLAMKKSNKSDLEFESLTSFKLFLNSVFFFNFSLNLKFLTT